jgi:threonine/homoserine/homoserine lactone efflux protein
MSSTTEASVMLARGLVLGFSIAAPVGPIGVLCIRRTLAEGRAIGLATGLGAAVADGVYGAIAAFGLTAVSGALIAHQGWVRALGGLFLLGLGLRTFLARPAADAAEARGGGLAGSFGSTFVLTLTNPMTILSFAAVFAGLGLAAGASTPALAAALVAGVVLGSAAWWLVLSAGVDRLRARFDQRGLVWVNRLSGAILLGFGAAALLAARGSQA